MSQIDELRKEADDLGITYSKNLGEDKLKQRIEEHYEKLEAGAPDVTAQVQEQAENDKQEAAAKALDAFTEKRMARERNARSTRIVTIIDNDQRVNNQTTTCTVNCSNEYFDLGTVILPLNEKIEVSKGHLNTLAAVQIPLHVRDNTSGMSTVKMRPRYTISYEDMKA